MSPSSLASRTGLARLCQATGQADRGACPQCGAPVQPTVTNALPIHIQPRSS